MAGIVIHRAETGTAAYDIHIGTGALMVLKDNPFIAAADRVIIVANATVWRIYGPRIIELLGEVPVLMQPDGEKYKSFSQAASFLEEMASLGLTRKSMVISLGGGATGDFAGFLAAVYMRGISFIQVPTTLLAMVDSSVGGKVAVNINVGKNLVGAFHQPVQVVSDMELLLSLPEHEIKNGMAEICKHALIGDGNTLDFLESFDEPVSDNEHFASLVYNAVVFKSGVVAADEKEQGLREILNFGHTVGHAVEGYFGYEEIAHGEAVALGMYAAIELSLEQGRIDEHTAMRAKSLVDCQSIQRTGITVSYDGLMQHLVKDKKADGQGARFVLLEGIGKPVQGCRVTPVELKAALNRVASYTSLEVIL